MTSKGSSSGSNWDQLQKSLDRRMKYDERIKFDTPIREGCNGFFKDLTLNGGMLLTIDPLKVNTEVLLYLTLSIGSDKMECAITGFVKRIDRSVAKPLTGYQIEFFENNPDAVKDAVAQLVEGQKAESLTQQPSSAPIPVPKDVPVIPDSPTQRPLPEEAKPTVPTGTPKPSPMRKKPEKWQPTVAPPKLPSQALSRKSLIRIFGTFGIILLMIGLHVAYTIWSEARMKSNIPKNIPVVNVSLEGQDMFVTVTNSWIVSNAREEIEFQLTLFAEEMRDRRLSSIELMDEGNRTFALIMMPSGSKRGEPQIRLY